MIRESPMRLPKPPATYSNEPPRNHDARRGSLPDVVRRYLTRRELLMLVPLSMSSIDALEKAGEFPSRFILAPTIKVAWDRHEVDRWLAARARTRVYQSRENNK